MTEVPDAVSIVNPSATDMQSQGVIIGGVGKDGGLNSEYWKENQIYGGGNLSGSIEGDLSGSMSGILFSSDDGNSGTWSWTYGGLSGTWVANEDGTTGTWSALSG